MRVTLPTVAMVAGMCLSGLLAGCTVDTGSTNVPVTEQSQESTPQPDGGLPSNAEAQSTPDAATLCPYLDTAWVAETNGQIVTAVGVDERFNTPACQFWSYQDEPQLTVIVRHMPSAADAMEVVDWAAPIEVTSPASEPAGWNGGRYGGSAVPGRSGAGYSVARGPIAVTVFTNQDESVKAHLVAEEVIATLGL